MYTWTFKRYVRGEIVEIVQTESNTMSGAVSKLSDMYAGVFLFVRKQ